jgi:serine/threonine protein kinase
MTLQIGEKVGAYTIQAPIGQGGMATVYKAYHAELDRHVAIKVIHPNFLDDESFVARFVRESQIVARLNHPNIVPVYDYDRHDQRPYLVMKYIEGETLKERLSRGVMPIEDILHIMDGVAKALDYAHQEGILHRDVKPSNVVIDHNGHAYLTDFGLARTVQAGQSTLSADMLLGTPHYISPEQAKGMKDIDGRTDVYSFGVMLYELFVGRVPFMSDSHYAVISDHINTPVPTPSLINEEIPEAVSDVIVKALAKRASQRYPTAGAVMLALKEAIARSRLQRLSEDRAIRADASLAQYREARAIAEQDEDLSVSNTSTPMLASTSQRPTTSYQTASVVRTHQGRGWVIGGFSVFLLSFFVGFVVLLGAVDNLVQLGQVLARNREGFHGIVLSETMLTTELINVGMGVEMRDEVPFLTIPTISVSRAQEVVERSASPLSQLLLAKAHWSEDNKQEAYRAVWSGQDFSFQPYYWLTAARIAQEMGDTDAHVSYLLYMVDLDSRIFRPFEDTLVSVGSQLLYKSATNIKKSSLNNIISNVFGEVLPLERRNAIVESSTGRLLQIHVAILNGELDRAEELLSGLQTTDYIASEKDLLEGELLLAQGKTQEAKEKFVQLQRQPLGRRAWILERINELLNTIEDITS